MTTLRDQVRVALISMTSTDDKVENIRKAFTWVELASAGRADWVVLPEVFSFIGNPELLCASAEDLRGQLWQELSQLSKRLGIILFAGSFAERVVADGSGKVANVSYVFGRSGEELARYQKTHLFSLNKLDGTSVQDESQNYLAGDSLPLLLDVDGFKVCLAICFDLRFPGFFLKFLRMKEDLDVIVCPSAFTQHTGRDHWHLLLKARAIDSQVYVLGANQVGIHCPGKQSFGQSAVVDPWGDIVASIPPKTEGFAQAILLKKRIQEVRNKLPVIGSQRFDLY